jgi:type IV fimbrial biogenesis protein FimT
MVGTPIPRPARSQSGFTMVETLAVVMIIAILAAFAAPAMKDLIRTQRVRTVAYDLLADLTFARSQAITLGHNVQFASVASSTDWLSGYTITDTSVTPNRTLRTQSSADPSLAFTADAASVTFDRSGRASAGTVSFNIAPTDSTAPALQKRCVRIDPSGRPRAVEGACS